jgi:prepilin-type N-terminal cleavage/methylation domain-containing protein
MISCQRGFSLIEFLIATVLVVVVIGMAWQNLDAMLVSEASIRHKNQLTHDANAALQHMVQAVERTRFLMLPLAENVNSAANESVRVFPPRAEFPYETAVLAVALDPTLDRDRDGFADANNDKDFFDLNKNGVKDPGELERIDEDLPSDTTFDNAAGIILIDDDNDGVTDEAGSNSADDNENGLSDEDSINGRDDDLNGAADDDPNGDMNADGKPGIGGVDDNGNGVIDDANSRDDDEDGKQDEDWLDAVVYYIAGNVLMERMPDVNPADGRAYTASKLIDNVSFFKVERLVQHGAANTVRLTLTVSSGSDSVSLTAQVRAGSGL